MSSFARSPSLSARSSGARENVFVHRLALGVPYHCYLMDSVEADFRAGLRKVTSRPPHLLLDLHASADTLRDAGIDAVYTTTLRREGDDALELARLRTELFMRAE